jgi:cell division protein FtsL
MRRTTALPLPGVRRGSLRSQALRQVQPVQRGRLPAAIWLGVIGIAFAAFLPVLQTSDATSAGSAAHELERARDRLQAEVRLLASQVGELTALSRVERVARERLGLVPARPTVALEVEPSPPARLLPARFLPTRSLDLREALPWWQSLFDVLVLR